MNFMISKNNVPTLLKLSKVCPASQNDACYAQGLHNIIWDGEKITFKTLGHNINIKYEIPVKLMKNELVPDFNYWFERRSFDAILGKIANTYIELDCSERLAIGWQDSRAEIEWANAPKDTHQIVLQDKNHETSIVPANHLKAALDWNMQQNSKVHSIIKIKPQVNFSSGIIWRMGNLYTESKIDFKLTFSLNENFAASFSKWLEVCGKRDIAARIVEGDYATKILHAKCNELNVEFLCVCDEAPQHNEFFKPHELAWEPLVGASLQEFSDAVNILKNRKIANCDFSMTVAPTQEADSPESSGESSDVCCELALKSTDKKIHIRSQSVAFVTKTKQSRKFSLCTNDLWSILNNSPENSAHIIKWTPGAFWIQVKELGSNPMPIEYHIAVQEHVSPGAPRKKIPSAADIPITLDSDSDIRKGEIGIRIFNL